MVAPGTGLCDGTAGGDLFKLAQEGGHFGFDGGGLGEVFGEVWLQGIGDFCDRVAIIGYASGDEAGS